MARTCILTLEPGGLGGVPHLAETLADAHRAWGHEPRFVYTEAESVPTTRMEYVHYLLRSGWPRREVRRGVEGLAIPLWPLPMWLGYYLPLIVARAAIMQSHMLAAVSGSAHAGFPFVMAQRPFIIWVAALYGDELRGRAAVGDAWARGVVTGPGWQRLEQMERRALESAAAILALSPHTARRISDYLPHVASRIRVVLSPVDIDRFHPANGATARPPGGPFLLLTARIRDPRKNLPLLLSAFAHVRARRPDLRLVITGDPPLPGHASLCAELGLEGSVDFAKHVPPEELIRLYQTAELFVLSSTQEGLSISMLEALACGLPAIATRCGGPEGVLEDGVTGRFVPNNDAEALAEAILETLADRAGLSRMRARAREFALSTFARPIIESELRAVFAEVYPQYF